MPFAALTYPVRKGFDAQIAEIFSAERFRRVDSPVMTDPGDVVGFLVATALFLQDGTVVRVIQHEGGTVEDVGRHMSVQEGVHEAERALMPFLPYERDTETAAGFSAHFDRSLMVEVDQRAVSNAPAPAVTVLRYPVRAGADWSIRHAYSVAGRPVPPFALWGVQRTALFLRPGEFVLRVFQHDPSRELPMDEVYELDRWLESYRTAIHGPVEPMPSVSFLSAAAVV